MKEWHNIKRLIFTYLHNNSYCKTIIFNRLDSLQKLN